MRALPNTRILCRLLRFGGAKIRRVFQIRSNRYKNGVGNFYVLPGEGKISLF